MIRQNKHRWHRFLAFAIANSNSLLFETTIVKTLLADFITPFLTVTKPAGSEPVTFISRKDQRLARRCRANHGMLEGNRIVRDGEQRDNAGLVSAWILALSFAGYHSQDIIPSLWRGASMHTYNNGCMLQGVHAIKNGMFRIPPLLHDC